MGSRLSVVYRYNAFTDLTPLASKFVFAVVPPDDRNFFVGHSEFHGLARLLKDYPAGDQCLKSVIDGPRATDDLSNVAIMCKGSVDNI